MRSILGIIVVDITFRISRGRGGPFRISNPADTGLWNADQLDGEDALHGGIVLYYLQHQLIGIVRVVNLDRGPLEKLVVEIQTSATVGVNSIEKLRRILQPNKNKSISKIGSKLIRNQQPLSHSQAVTYMSTVKLDDISSRNARPTTPVDLARMASVNGENAFSNREKCAEKDSVVHFELYAFLLTPP